MNFSKQQADPRRHLVGIAFVVLFHAFIVWALVSGLAKKVVEVVRAPIETKVIEEIKKPPPPPEVVMPPPPKLDAPPPPFIPPPEVEVAAPPPEPTIVATTPTPPPAPVPLAPAPPVAAPEPPKAPPAVAAGSACTKIVNPEAPLVPASTGITGALVAYQAVMQGSNVASFEITKLQMRGGSDNKVRRALIGSVEAAVRQYACANGVAFRQEIEFKFTE
jgi:periplasmic protein TonB